MENNIIIIKYYNIIATSNDSNCPSNQLLMEIAEATNSQ